MEYVSKLAAEEEEQSASSMSISESMLQIIGVVQDAANGAQESAGAAAELAGSALAGGMVSRFKSAA